MSATGGSGDAGAGVSQNAEASPTASATENVTANTETGAGAAPTVESAATATATVANPAQMVARLTEIHDRVMPILDAVRREYAPRVMGGYPTVIDNVQRGGIFGISFAPGFGAYFLTDGSGLFAEMHTVALRTDTLSNANGEKFGGSPIIIQRPIDDTWTDLHYRNFVSELLSKWNFQQTRIFRVDS